MLNRVYRIDGRESEFEVADERYDWWADDAGEGPNRAHDALTQIWIISYGYVTGDGKEEALIIFGHAAGGAGHHLEGNIFSLLDGTPTQIGHIPGGDRSAGGVAALQAEEATLIVKRFDGTSKCCPESMVVERWVRNNQVFEYQEVVATEELSGKPWRKHFGE